VLAAVAARRHGLPLYRGILGRANGGMIVHVGIVVIAVGIAAAGSFASRSSVTLSPGQSVAVDGHVVRLESVRTFVEASRSGDEAIVQVDGRGVLRPAIDTFTGTTQQVGTPAFTSSLFEDVYVAPTTLLAKRGEELATLQIVVQPLVSWLWIGGAIVAAGALLAALPGRRRRPTDPSTLALPELEGLEWLAHQEQGAGR
jgi:cytochrome c-type biogenesis protein CcmF